MKKTVISLAVAAAFGSGVAHAYTAVVTTTNNNFTMVGATDGNTGGNNDTTLTWDGTYRTAVPTDGLYNATLSSPTAFSGKKWTAHHVNVYAPGTYTIYTGCASGGVSSTTYDPTCGAGTAYTLTVGAGQVGAHMLFNWSVNSDIDVVVLWDMNKSWNQTGTTSPFNTSTNALGNTADTVWSGVSIDTPIDPDNYSGTKMVDGPFIGQAANFSVNGITAATTPTVASSDMVPASGATAVAPNSATSIAVTFSEAMDVASVQSAFTVTGGGGDLCAAIVASNSDKTFSCTHNALALSTVHTATVSTAAKSAAGIPLAAPVSWSFTTHSSDDVVAPTVSGALMPVDGTVNALNSQVVEITFSEPMAATTAGAMSVTADGVAVAGSFIASNSNQTFTFSPTAGVLPNSGTIVVTVPSGGAVKDIAGNPLAASPAWSFTTEVPASLAAGGNTVSATGGDMVSIGTMTTAAAESLAATFSQSPPAGVTFDNGFVKYTVNNVAGAATIRIVFPVDITGKSFYKFKESNGVYIPLTAGSGANQYQVVNSTTIDLNIVDNGPLDDNSANTIVSDPVGIATTAVATAANTLGAAPAGGGCAFGPNGKLDPTMLMMLLGSLGYLGWKRKQRN